MGSKGRFETQDNNEDAWVGVSSDGYDKQSETPIASDFLIEGKNPRDHHHLGFDEDGNEIFHTQR